MPPFAVVLHAAAQMSWLLPYRDLFASNVEGTRELLQFAAESRGASVHHVSSLGTTLIRPFDDEDRLEQVGLALTVVAREHKLFLSNLFM